VITASPDHTKGVYGWCTGWKAWKGEDEDGYYEINLCAEYLSRPFLDVCETLLHEMVHLANLQNGVKDTSRSGTYHNKEFKVTAEAHGLTVSKTKSGWNKTALTEETAEWIQSIYNSEIGFTLYREKLLKISGVKKKSSSRKYVCPSCGAIIRATKEVNITCSDCDEPFEER
jgi:rubrerythrin